MTRAGIERGAEDEARGEGDRLLGSADGDRLILQRLAEHFENTRVELEEFIQEEDAPVGKGDLARARDRPAADQSRVRNGVVRGGRPDGYEARPRPRARDAVMR